MVQLRVVADLLHSLRLFRGGTHRRGACLPHQQGGTMTKTDIRPVKLPPEEAAVAAHAFAHVRSYLAAHQDLAQITVRHAVAAGSDRATQGRRHRLPHRRHTPADHCFNTLGVHAQGRPASPRSRRRARAARPGDENDPVDGLRRHLRRRPRPQHPCATSSSESRTAAVTRPSGPIRSSTRSFRNILKDRRTSHPDGAAAVLAKLRVWVPRGGDAP